LTISWPVSDPAPPQSPSPPTGATSSLQASPRIWRTRVWKAWARVAYGDVARLLLLELAGREEGRVSGPGCLVAARAPPRSLPAAGHSRRPTTSCGVCRQRRLGRRLANRAWLSPLRARYSFSPGINSRSGTSCSPSGERGDAAVCVPFPARHRRRFPPATAGQRSGSAPSAVLASSFITNGLDRPRESPAPRLGGRQSGRRANVAMDPTPIGLRRP